MRLSDKITKLLGRPSWRTLPSEHKCWIAVRIDVVHGNSIEEQSWRPPPPRSASAIAMTVDGRDVLVEKEGAS